MLTKTIPNNLDEAVAILTEYYKDKLSEIADMTEDKFIGNSHHSLGQGIRNDWNLWWHENHSITGWPKEKPALTEYFNNLGIYHGDDLSGIILTSFYRGVVGKDRDLEGQIKVYKKHWKQQGFKDGIYDYKRKS